jgi:hypothetical protein
VYTSDLSQLFDRYKATENSEIILKKDIKVNEYVFLSLKFPFSFSQNVARWGWGRYIGHIHPLVANHILEEGKRPFGAYLTYGSSVQNKVQWLLR